VTCHADVHKGSLGPACTRCHSAQVPFKSATTNFDHAVTRFPLLGAHRTATCERCHAASTFKGVKFAACTDCHKSPHAPTVSTACVTCHSNDNWKTKKFDHARTSFPLAGKHVAADCASCHKAPAAKVKPAAGTCVTCHRDPHSGEFAQDCKSCHSENGFSGATFDHSAKTRFGLTDGHAAPACRACHTNVTAAAVPIATKRLDFRGLKTGCVICHADPHQGEMAGTCETCHSTKTFRVSSFVHPRTPEFFAGQHAGLACASCHKPTATPAPAKVLKIKFTAAPTACASCHTDVHAGQVGTDCQSCHSIKTAKFALAGFSHDRTTFSLTGKHQTVACALCHKRETSTFPSGAGTAVRLTGMSSECRTCHADVHLGQIRNACETCHTTSSFKVAAYKHRNPQADFFVGRHVGPSCEACHKRVTAAFPAGNGTAVRFQVGTTCISCHADVHNGALGQDCARCHKPAPPVAAHLTRRSTP
jgi:hypothetical protein